MREYPWESLYDLKAEARYREHRKIEDLKCAQRLSEKCAAVLLSLWLITILYFQPNPLISLGAFLVICQVVWLLEPYILLGSYYWDDESTNRPIRYLFTYRRPKRPKTKPKLAQKLKSLKTSFRQRKVAFDRKLIVRKQEMFMPGTRLRQLSDFKNNLILKHRSVLRFVCYVKYPFHHCQVLLISLVFLWIAFCILTAVPLYIALPGLILCHPAAKFLFLLYCTIQSARNLQEREELARIREENWRPAPRVTPEDIERNIKKDVSEIRQVAAKTREVIKEVKSAEVTAAREFKKRLEGMGR